MDSHSTKQSSNNSTDIYVGQSVIKDDREYIIAEIHNGNCVLYRERVDGRSETFEMSVDEVVELIRERDTNP